MAASHWLSQYPPPWRDLIWFQSVMTAATVDGLVFNFSTAFFSSFFSTLHFYTSNNNAARYITEFAGTDYCARNGKLGRRPVWYVMIDFLSYLGILFICFPPPVTSYSWLKYIVWRFSRSFSVQCTDSDAAALTFGAGRGYPWLSCRLCRGATDSHSVYNPPVLFPFPTVRWKRGAVQNQLFLHLGCD